MKLAFLILIAAVIPGFFVLLFVSQARHRRRQAAAKKLAATAEPGEESRPMDAGSSRTPGTPPSSPDGSRAR